MKEKKTQPTNEEYKVNDCNVCDIENFIGTDSSLCGIYYSAPTVQYNYGYEYKVIRANGYSLGYYIGIARFFSANGEWAKEYMLYEYALFEEIEEKEANECLYAYLLEQAAKSGCSRIICEKEGGNAEFYSYFTENGFIDNGVHFELPLFDVKLPERDEALLPAKGDKVTFEQAYFLREQGFSVNKDFLHINYEGKEISISRSTGICKFSDDFKIIGEKNFVLDSQRALSLIDVCLQMMPMGIKEEIRIYLPEEKSNALSPDVLVDKWGIFVLNEHLSFENRRYFLADLKKEGFLETVSFYEFTFNFEVGGRKLNLYLINLNKK